MQGNLIRDAPVLCGLASVAYIGPDDQLRAIWDDPPPPDTGPSDANLDLSEEEYFEVYYKPILTLLQAVRPDFESNYGKLAYLPTIDVFVGLQEDIRNALQLRRFEDLRDFAKRHLSLRQNNIVGSGGELLFADGLIVRAGSTWSDPFMTESPRVGSR